MIDLRPVFYVVGMLLGAIALAMLLPAAVDAVEGRREWQVFFVSAAATGFVGGVLALSCRRSGPFEMDVRQAFLLTSLAWVACAAFGALPFVFGDLGLDYTNAFFESMSGLTTTGSTVISKLDELPKGILFWRSFLQWLGGIGIVVVAIIILPFLRVGGMQLFRTESSDRSEKVVPRSAEMVVHIVVAYLVVSVAAAFSYWLAGMSGFDAINHMMTTVATGGYSTHDASFGYFQQPAIHWAGTVFMLAGALPFTAYVRAVLGHNAPLWRDSQVRAYVLFLAVVIVATGLWLWQSKGMDLEPAMRAAAFNIVSIATTTGYATTDYQLWGAPAVGLFLFLTFVGGCTGSTGGGIKMFRFQILWIITRGYLDQLLRPHKVAVPLYQGKRVPDEVLFSILAFLVAFAGAVVAISLALSGFGLDLVTALSASAQAMANVGPGLGDIVGPAGNYATLPDGAKWLLAFAMLLGRLELFTVLVLLKREFWRW